MAKEPLLTRIGARVDEIAEAAVKPVVDHAVNRFIPEVASTIKTKVMQGATELASMLYPGLPLQGEGQAFQGPDVQTPSEVSPTVQEPANNNVAEKTPANPDEHLAGYRPPGRKDRGQGMER